jgi:hypothetical protein
VTHQSRLHLLAPVMTEIATERRAAGSDDFVNLPYTCAVMGGTPRLYPCRCWRGRPPGARDHCRPWVRPGARVFPICRLTLRPGETLPMMLEHRVG